MDIHVIKQQSNQLYQKYKKQVIPEFFYVGYVGILAQYLRSGIFSFFCITVFMSNKSWLCEMCNETG